MPLDHTLMDRVFLLGPGLGQYHELIWRDKSTGQNSNVVELHELAHNAEAVVCPNEILALPLVDMNPACLKLLGGCLVLSLCKEPIPRPGRG